MNILIAPRAYAEGYQANLDGKPRLSPNGTTNRAGWLQGYDAAQAVRDEWEADNHARACEVRDCGSERVAEMRVCRRHAQGMAAGREAARS